MARRWRHQVGGPYGGWRRSHGRGSPHRQCTLVRVLPAAGGLDERCGRDVVVVVVGVVAVVVVVAVRGGGGWQGCVRGGGEGRTVMLMLKLWHHEGGGGAQLRGRRKGWGGEGRGQR